MEKNLRLCCGGVYELCRFVMDLPQKEMRSPKGKESMDLVQRFDMVSNEVKNTFIGILIFQMQPSTVFRAIFLCDWTNFIKNSFSAPRRETGTARPALQSKVLDHENHLLSVVIFGLLFLIISKIMQRVKS